jgi:hypothetical protein
MNSPFSAKLETTAGDFDQYSLKTFGAAYRKGIGMMGEDEYEAAIVAFLRAKGVTRCPTACALPTQGTIPASDRAALEDYAIARARSRRQRQATRERSFWAARPSAD